MRGGSLVPADTKISDVRWIKAASPRISDNGWNVLAVGCSYPQAGPVSTNPVPVRPKVSTPEGERYFPDRVLHPASDEKSRLGPCCFCQRPHMVGAERGQIDGVGHARRHNCDDAILAHG